jgi:hypothetical protein
MDTKIIKTHSEAVLKWICSTLSEHYALNDESVREIRTFLSQGAENAVATSQNRFVFLTEDVPVKTFMVEPKVNDANSFYVTIDKMSMIPSGVADIPASESPQNNFSLYLANACNNNNF